MSLLQRLGSSYRRHPLISNMLLYVGLYGTGDLSRQTILHDKSKGQLSLDFHSAARMSTVGSLLIAPYNYNFYKILDKIVKGSGARVVVTKIVCDQIFSTPVTTCLFYVGEFSFGRPFLTICFRHLDVVLPICF